MPGINNDTKLMLHCNGTDGSTTFTDSSLSPKTITAYGTAQIDTSESKFGGASGFFDGNSDYLTTPDSDDFNILASTGDSWTIDFWVYILTSTGERTIISQTYNSSNYWLIGLNSGGYFKFETSLSGVSVDSSSGLSNNTWHHVAFIKVENKLAGYFNGTQCGYDTFSSTTNIAGNLSIGRHSIWNNYFHGYLDEIRFQKSNFFNANPNVGLTDTITVPTEEYSETANLYIPSQGIIII